MPLVCGVEQEVPDGSAVDIPKRVTSTVARPTTTLENPASSISTIKRIAGGWEGGAMENRHDCDGTYTNQRVMNNRIKQTDIL